MSARALEFGGGSNCIEWSRHFQLDDQRIASHLGQHLGARESDLLDIAAAAYVADRTMPRPKGDSMTWGRDIAVRIAVRDLAFWSDAENGRRLSALLDWLTDDRWSIDFTGSVRWRRQAEQQEQLFTEPLSSSARIGLYSGGLDSVAGAARELAMTDDELVLVSAATMAPLARLQRRTISALCAASGRSVRSMIVPIQLDGRELEQQGLSKDAETTQRSRGFVFFVLGVVAAITSGLDELRVFENGIGALNLPQAESQTGSMTTRAMHPRTLELVGRLATAVADRPVRVVNDSFALTKAELLDEMPAWAAEAAALSLSCDTSLTYRGRDRRQHPLCGACTSCILRRQALRASNWSELDRDESRRYRADVFESDVAHRDALAMRDMLAQAYRLSDAVHSNDPWAALVSAFPSILHARRALGDVGQDQLLRLIGAYCDEWQNDAAPLARRYLGEFGIAA